MRVTILLCAALTFSGAALGETTKDDAVKAGITPEAFDKVWALCQDVAKGQERLAAQTGQHAERVEHCVEGYLAMPKRTNDWFAGKG
ncbi:hypothetical protein [Ferrimonas balearica]|uniref:hypothetical protein n=1 Tax=Ferrimonas balearica TaxID=44012 RepID=UPI001C994682|nr:hypothetical protein [Ferrimonas balearica]MBY5991335.1 hypothetical protein [Ferrimonas balearica]